MELGIRGKVAMIAAASKGIGLATAKRLAAEGCLVSICARNEETLTAAAAEIAAAAGNAAGEEVRSYVIDVSDRDDLAWWVQQTRDDLGPISILVTNTGGPPAGPLGDMTDSEWQVGFDGTLMNIVRLVREVSPDMKAAEWGRIVHITSLVAKQPSPLLPISSTLRAGIMALTRLQSTELAPFGITVNGVLPGHTLTDRQHHLAEIRAARDGITPEEALARQGREIPAGRLADPDEIAATIAFLCSVPAAYVAGTSLLVDGGLTAGLG
jgi:3-oxoacyl-[acyl-carrier protein] reductase